ncbi:MAG: PAS domain S-box protein, partial [Deltaproteobacteria bacterium]|nr:PAS domain S-box protein [Deltaproteobacteria bacterium]
MSGKPTYEELEQKVKELERAIAQVKSKNKINEALRESEEKFRSLVDNAPNFVTILNLDGSIQYINRTVPGIHPEEVVGKKFYEHAAPEYHSLMKDTIERVSRTGERAGYTFKGVGPYSTASWYDVQVGSINRNGKMVAVTEFLTDITKRKQAEKALRESEEKYRDLVETIEELIWEVDIEGTYTYVSSQARALYGFTPEEVIGSPLFEFMPPEEAMRVKALFHQIVASQQPFLALESTARHRDGHLVFMENRGSPFFSPDGRLLGYRGIAIDITGRKQSEEALRESEKKYRLLAENVSDVIWTIDLELKFTYVSS